MSEGNSSSNDLLAPLPSLEETHLRLHAGQSPEFGSLEAFVPGAAPYQCADPNLPALVLVPGLGMDGLGFLRQLALGPHAHLHFFRPPTTPS